MAVGVELSHRRHHGLDLVLLAGQRRNQLAVMQTGQRRGQPDLHESHRVGRQLDEGGVAVVDGVADALGEVDAVPQPLLPIVDIVDRLTARTNVGALVDGGEVADVQRVGLDALQLGGQLAQQWIHLGGVAGTLGRELAGEPALFLAALDDRVHLGRRPADDGLARRGVNAHLEVGEIGEHRADLVGGILHQCHQPDVVTEEHGFALAHQMRARADGAGGVSQRQTTGEVGGGGLAQRLPYQCSRFRTMVLEQFAEGDLDGEDHQLHNFDRVLTRLIGVVDRIVEDQFDDGVAPLVLNERINFVDPLCEHLVA